MHSIIKTIFNTFGRYRLHVGALVLFGVISPLLEGIGVNAVVPLLSFFMGGGNATDFINEAVQGLFSLLHIPFSFRYLLAFILVLFIFRAVSVIVFGYIRGWINADFLGKESEDVMRRTLLSSWAFSLKQKIGTMHNTLVRDVQQTGSLLGAVVQVIQSFSGFIIYLIIAVNISPIMTLYAVCGGAVLMFVLRPFLRRTENIGRQTAGVEKQFAQFLSEHIIGMKSIKAAGVEKSAISSGAGHIRLLRHLSIQQSFVSTVSTSLFQPSSIVLVAILFLLTYHTSEFNIISFTAALYLIQKIFAYLESGQNAMQSVRSLLPYAKNLESFKKNLDAHKEGSEGKEPFMFNKEISFENISFSYEKGRPVLDDVSFSVKAGETVGLIGPSGAGKTSIVDLVLRLFKPDRGHIKLDGVVSGMILLDEWRSNIGYVPQDVFLINDTIEENIRFYNKDLSMADIENAAKQANIYDFIIGLPEGFKTITGDRGVMLSGGQRQRVALARALASKSKILILDEATSALDHKSEKLIQDVITKLHGSVTVFIIAHRPSTVASADNIVVLDHGRIVEIGKPHDLLEKPDSYFYKMQHKS